MESEKGCGIGAEYPCSHLVQLIFIILFVSAWIIDGLFFQLSIQFGNLKVDILRIVLFLIFLILSYLLIKSSGFIISEEVIKDAKIIDTGIYAHVRHPMYLGILLIYFAFVFLTLSLICLFTAVFITFFMNLMTTYEENALEKVFGNEYLEYINTVPKWIPRLKIN